MLLAPCKDKDNTSILSSATTTADGLLLPCIHNGNAAALLLLLPHPTGKEEVGLH